MTVCGSVPRRSDTLTSLKAPSRPNAPCSASRPSQITPNRRSSGMSAPGAIAYTYSGDSAMPTTESSRHRPFMIARSLSPTLKP